MGYPLVITIFKVSSFQLKIILIHIAEMRKGEMLHHRKTLLKKKKSSWKEKGLKNGVKCLKTGTQLVLTN